VLFEEAAELTGQRNAIDGRLVDIVAEIDHDGLCGMTGARSVAAMVAWKTGTSPRNAETIATIAHRLDEFPVCTQAMREGRLSLDQVGVIAERAADGSDEHYAQLAAVATVTQLRKAIKLAPRPKPEPAPDPRRRDRLRCRGRGGTRAPAAAGAVDHQDRRRAVHHLPDHPAARRGRDVRRRRAVPPRRADRRVETRPRRRQRPRPQRRCGCRRAGDVVPGSRRRVDEPGRGRLGHRRRSRVASTG
jgi:hypothetical protein